MGLDTYWYRIKNFSPKDLEDDDFYFGEFNNNRVQLGYLRKPYWLMDWLSKHNMSVQNGEYRLMTKTECETLRVWLDKVINKAKVLEKEFTEKLDSIVDLETGLDVNPSEVHSALLCTTWTFAQICTLSKYLHNKIIPAFNELKENEGIYFEADW